jgi:uncharacterized RDD family membrane protein YckC
MDDARRWLGTTPGVDVEAAEAQQPGDPWGAPVPRPGAPESTPAPGGRPAGVWIRALAFLVDLVVVAILWVVGVWLARALAAVGSWTVLIGEAFGITWRLLAPPAYFVLGHGTEGWTLGKRLLGIRVVDLRGEPIGYLHAVGRSLAWALALLPFGLGLVVAAARRDRRALHDLIAGTKVVRER